MNPISGFEEISNSTRYTEGHRDKTVGMKKGETLK